MILDFPQIMVQLEMRQQFGLGAGSEDELRRVEIGELGDDHIAKAGGVDDQAAGIPALLDANLLGDDVPVPLPDTHQVDDSTMSIGDGERDADGGGFLAGQVPAGDVEGFVIIGIAIDSDALIEECGVDVLTGDNFGAGVDELTEDVLGDRAFAEVLELLIEIGGREVDVLAGVAGLDVSGIAAVGQVAHLAIKPVAAVRGGNKVKFALAVEQAHLGDAVDDIVGLFVVGDFIEDEIIVVVAEEVFAPVMGGAGVDNGAVGQDQARVGGEGEGFGEVGQKGIGSEEAGDGIEDDFGLVEGEAGDGEVVFAAAIVAGVANLEEGTVDDFEGGDE